jgi:large subunit ribosomal protein L21
MKYAVISIQGKQYKVAPGQELLVEKLKDKEANAEVLLVVNDGEVLIGKPTLDTKIALKVLGDEKGEKIHVRKYKAKSRYRKHIGFRASLTRLQVSEAA